MLTVAHDWYVVVGACAVGVALVLARVPALTVDGTRVSLGSRMGPGSWSFSDSWASNLTTVGAFLTTILTASIFNSPSAPVKPLIDDYVSLSLFFALLTIVAALVYSASSSDIDVLVNGERVTQRQGWVWSFLVAGALTLWSTLGQLATVALVFKVIADQQYLSAVAMDIFWAVLAAAILGALVYGWRSIPCTVAEQVKVHAQRTKAFADSAVAGTPPLPTWSLL